MAEVAHHLEAAYQTGDLELLGSLLHPEVHWTGLCNSSADDLDCYRQSIADGTRAGVVSVEVDRDAVSVEVDRDAVVLGIDSSGTAEGAWPAPPERLYQVFTIDNGGGRRDTWLPRPRDRPHPRRSDLSGW